MQSEDETHKRIAAKEQRSRETTKAVTAQMADGQAALKRSRELRAKLRGRQRDGG
jgi:hypothetical protein